MATTKYYDPSGAVHKVRTERAGYGGYEIYLDDSLYAQADDRIELDDAIQSLVKYKKYTVVRPKKSKKNTPPKALASN